MANWDKTKNLKNRLGDKIKNELYKGQPVINRDSQIKGVYLGEHEREAIVVNLDLNKSLGLKKLYEEAKRKATVNGKINKSRILEAVFYTVENAMPVTPDGENKVSDFLTKKRIKPDQEISLDEFINNNIGVCRHHALACGALLELFKKDGYIKGTPRVNRNSTYRGGHAWCRYTNSASEVYILDVTQGYIGTLKDAPKKAKWDYKKPDDI